MIPCPSCSRFIRNDTRTCPFCDATVSSAPAVMGPMAGALLGLTLAACGGDDTGDEGADSGQVITDTAVAAYGGPEVDTSIDDGIPPEDDDANTTDGGGTSSGGSDSGSGTTAADGSSSGSGTGDTGSGSGTDTGSSTTA